MHTRVSRPLLLGWPAPTLTGLLLRVLLIGSKSIWLDEVNALRVTLAGPQAWLSGAADAFHPPLYFAFLSVWVRLGQSEAALRLSSALFGVLAIPVAYALARSLAGRGVGLAAAWLTALSPLLTWYAQDFRPYSLLVFLALLSSLALVRLLLRPGAGWWLLYVLSTAAALYTHYDAVVVVPFQAALLLALLAQGRVARWGAAAALLAWPAIAAAFWPWLSSPTAAGVTASIVGTGAYPAMLVKQTLGLEWGAALALAAVLGAALIAAALAAWQIIRRRGLWPRLYRSPVLRGLLAAAFVVLLIVSVVPRGYSLKRHTVIAIPFICLAVAWFWPLAGRLSKTLAVLLALSAAAALVNVVAIPKDDWRATVAHLQAVYQAGDAVWVTPGYDNMPFDYYNRGRLPVTPIDDAQPALDPANAARRIWLVYNNTPTLLVDNGPRLEAALGATHRPAAEWSAYRMRVVLFEPN